LALKRQAIDEVIFLCKVEKLSIALAFMMGTGSLISGFLLSYTGWQAVNYTGVGHDFPRFIVMKSPEKILKVAPGHMSGNPG